MEQRDIFTGISILISVVALIISYLSKSNSDKAVKLQEASLNNQFNNSISKGSEGVSTALLLVNSNKNSPDIDLYKQAYKTAQETWLNAYDQACLCYREDRVKKQSFKMAYQVSVRNLVEDPNLDHFFNPAHKSKFPSILWVYEEWETSAR